MHEIIRWPHLKPVYMIMTISYVFLEFALVRAINNCEQLVRFSLHGRLVAFIYVIACKERVCLIRKEGNCQPFMSGIQLLRIRSSYTYNKNT